MTVPIEMWNRKGMTVHSHSQEEYQVHKANVRCVYMCGSNRWPIPISCLIGPLKPFWCQRFHPVGEGWCVWLVLTAVRHSQGALLMQEKSREEGKSSALRWVWLLLCDSKSSFQLFSKCWILFLERRHTVCHYIQLFLSVSVFKVAEPQTTHAIKTYWTYSFIYLCMN